MYNINSKGGIAVPVSIILAGLLIAVALYFSTSKQAEAPSAQQENKEVTTKEVPGVQKDDHILGNPDADIVIIEYSDTECPYCKKMHETMLQIMDKYGADGKVAWVYRQLPLPQLHPNAPKQAQATECAAKLGGNDAFWKFTNKIYEKTTSNNTLDMSLLPTFAEEAGLDKTAFQECLDSDYGKDIIAKHTQEAVEATGGRIGTPYNIFLFKGQQIPAPGYIPFEGMDKTIQQMLGQE